MQAARRVVDLAAELSAGMQRGHDDFEGGFVLEFGMRIDGDSASIVAHDQDIVRLQLDLDAVGVARHRFVHRIVHDFGGQVVQGPFVRAADIHAGPAPHRFEPFQDFDVLGGVAFSGSPLGRCGPGFRLVKQIANLCHA